MLRTFTLCVILCAINQFSSAQIVHKDYGEGLEVSLNANFPLDINSDGFVDFYINANPEELGFNPIFAKSCFTSNNINEKTSWGSFRPATHERGEVVGISWETMDSYIEDGAASIHHTTHGSDVGWEDDEPEFLAFTIFNNDLTMLNGWLSVKLDLSKNALVLLEYAYTSAPDFNEGAIEIGATLVSVDNLDEVLSDVIVRPNPVADIFSVDFNYTGAEQLNIYVSNSLGQLIEVRSANQNRSTFTFDASEWTSGLYNINFKTSDGVHTEKVQVIE